MYTDIFVIIVTVKIGCERRSSVWQCLLGLSQIFGHLFGYGPQVSIDYQHPPDSDELVIESSRNAMYLLSSRFELFRDTFQDA